MPKKNGKIRICVDYRDLNKVSPKDDFPLPNFHILIDNCAKHELQPFVDCFLLKKDAATKWTEECQKASDKIKEYLSNLPVLVPPKPGKPLLLYLSVLDNAFGCMLGQRDETERKE
uniref:Reverse transcriptase/retrotransposon-derived protein RNase H-like domain-containing protein n=1 Tax=Nicotiana tabacum TaxID=4097 RepID=A0A1S3Z4Z0_TOBAC|nr:PREDICTED: uncharacterized protein LOC107783014 [Nicotiana tabacum]